MIRLITRLALLSFPIVGRAQITTQNIDSGHSSLGFSISHNLVSHVPGSFTEFTGTISLDQSNPRNSSARAIIRVGSVNTGNRQRDGHLRGPNFFNGDKFATITFESTAWEKTGENTFDVVGNLTMHGVTKPVGLKVTLLRIGPGRKSGSIVSDWVATATINRGDFGVGSPALLDRTIGDDVSITISLKARDKNA